MAPKSYRILIVDDDQVVCKMHQFLVRRHLGQEAMVFHDGYEAFNYLEAGSLGEEPLLILLDLNMPVMDGFEFLKKIRDRPYRDQVYVVVVTSSTRKADCEEHQLFGEVCECYTKPLTIADFQAFDRLMKKNL